MTRTARGTFDVALVPQPPAGEIESAGPGRLTLDKRYAGDLQGTARGQMLAIRTATQGSAGYVAIETVTGTLEGRSGSFALQHSGTMDRGAASLSVTVIPDSATDGLTGLRGTLRIDVAEREHRYVFDYELPEQG